jgi:hypothetical protein
MPGVLSFREVLTCVLGAALISALWVAFAY